MSIEDEIFASAIEAQGFKRTKTMYEPADYKHDCSMCGTHTKSYRLKSIMDDIGTDTPYLFICDKCYNELPEE